MNYLSKSLVQVHLFKLIIPNSDAGNMYGVCPALALWNSLPENIRQSDTITKFKIVINTHLYKLL